MNVSFACSRFLGFAGNPAGRTAVAQFLETFLAQIMELARRSLGGADVGGMSVCELLDGLMGVNVAMSAADAAEMASALHTARTLAQVEASQVRCPSNTAPVSGPYADTPRAFERAREAFTVLARVCESMLTPAASGAPRDDSVQQLLPNSEPLEDTVTAHKAAEAVAVLRQCNDASLGLQEATAVVMMMLQPSPTGIDAAWASWWTAVYDGRVRPTAGDDAPTTADMMTRLVEAAEIMFWAPAGFLVRRGQADVHVSWSPTSPSQYLQLAGDMTEHMRSASRFMRDALANTIVQELRVPNVTRSLGGEHCTICHDNLMNDAVIAGVIVACRHNDVAHYYHEGCLRGWIVQGETPMLTQCPVCRGPLVSDLPQDDDVVVGFSFE